MPINTDLNVSPYFDDYSETSDFYKVLFRPGVSVQARELNQLQSILQKQIERFGDNIYKKGSIIDGCHFSFDATFQFVKLKDTQPNGLAVDVGVYIDRYVKNETTGLSAHVLTAISGFETSDPNLNTIYVRYQNSGKTGNVTEFSNGDVLRVRDADYPIYEITVNNGSTGFNNTNPVVFVSAIAVTNTLGGNSFATPFVVGNTISQTMNSITANAIITSVDYTTNTQVVILNIKPKDADLYNANSAIWTFDASANTSEQLTGTNGATGVIVDLIGLGASATMTTDSSLGAVLSVDIDNMGTGYYVPPFVSISGAPTGSITGLSLTAKNYMAEITVAENLTTNSVGTGYAFSVSEGIIYQKGYFSRVDAQRVIVERYNNTPNEKVVGFDTTESIVNSNIDSTLLDNATGEYNYNAPGANRLNLTPSLVVLDKTDAIANDNFFSIVEWSEGKPFKQNRNTAFNSVERELAQRTSEESGDYVLDPFYMYTKSPDTFALNANSFNVVIDPGIAYISGYRVETTESASKTVPKGITSGVDTQITTGTSISINYGNYIKVNEVGGAFIFNTGASISLRTLPKTYLTTGTLAAPTAAGDEIGQARIRSMVYESGEPGTAAAVYRLYLFDITMNAGKNFKDVKSVFYDDTYDAVADVVLELDASSQTNIAKIQEQSNNNLLIYSGVDALKSVSDISYTYRTVNNSITMNTLSGFTISAGTGESWPYSGGTISSAQEQDLIIVPLANAYVSSNSGGSVSVTATSQTVTGTSTTFISDYAVGDYILIANSGTSAGIKRITSILNNTTLYLAANAGTTVTFANTKLAFPQYAPIPFSTRSGRTASVAGGTLTVSLGLTMNTATTPIAVTYNMKTSSSTSKTAQRKRYVKIRPANNAANVSANAAGTVSGNTTSAVLIGSGTALNTAFAANDYIAIWANSTFYNLRRVSSVANSTYLTLTSNGAVANASATVAKVTSVNLTGPWPLGVPDIFRLRKVYVGNSSVNTSSTDITSNFYIESNQSENSYDIGLLYKKPTSTYTVGLDNYMLVEFDRFIASSPGGFKNINSYTIDDTKTLETLDVSAENSSINTLEIPEVHGMRSGEESYYDLRDHFDFRPYANATVTVANASSYATNAPINPSDVTFGTKFGTGDKKFPAPESSLITTVENYLGRSDAVIITSNGDFNVIKGVHGGGYPNIPNKSILINYLDIPSYPSLPATISIDVAKLYNRNIANGKYLNKRVNDYTISTPLSSTEISRKQPKGYTMEQIGELERRIADLEYYVSLSQTEDTVKNLSIPSSNDPTINRFKFGYFVDNFSSLNFADLDNPEFNATISNYELTPKKGQLNLEFIFDSADATQQYVTGHYATLPYASYPLVQQLNATTVGIGGGGGGGGGGPTTFTLKGQNINWHHSQNGYEYRDVKMADVSGPVVFYFDAQGHGLERFEIYQSLTPVNTTDYKSPSTFGLITPTTTSENAVVLTTTDRQFLESNKIMRKNLDGKIRYGKWSSTSSRPDFSFQSSGGNSKYYVKDCGKITWTHDPTKGRYYYIATKKGSFYFTGHIYFPATT